jgi:gamma-F420-2:alpha-L-glutamate ligase
MKYLYHFLNEAKLGNTKLKLVIITNAINGDKEDTPEVLAKKAKASGMDSFILKLDDCIIEDTRDKDGNITLYNKDDKKGFVVNNDNTVILARRGVVKNTYTRGILSIFETGGFFCINSSNAIDLCENKYITAQKLIASDLPTPRTALIPNENAIESALKEVGGQFPIILKTLSGSQGIGVSIIDSMGSLKSVLQTIWKLSNTEVLIQEKIDAEHDIRIHVLTKKFNYYGSDKENAKIIGQMRRNKVSKKDFRTNHSLGGTVGKIKLTPEQEDLAKRAANAMQCHWCGVDLITDKKTGKNYILEVNASPGTKGIMEVVGEGILDDIMNLIKNKTNWVPKVKEVGFREVIEVDGIGKFVAKFDSGNGAKSSTIHADSIEEKNGYVHWTLNKKKFKSKIVGHSSPEIGDKVHNRPIIELDIIFDGIVYRNIHFSLSDRTTKSTKMLINRKAMERMGIIVNPQKTFVVSPHNSYKAIIGKGNPHYGIEFFED